MEEIDTLIQARWVIPVEPAGVVHDHYALAVHQGRILNLLPQAAARARYRAAQVHELADHALIPGLVNAHTHAAMSLLRGLADDMPLMTWLTEHIWPAESRWVGAEFTHDGARLAFAEMLRGGTTCFNDMYFFPEVTARQASACGMRACVGMIVIDFPSAWASGWEQYLEKGLALHDEFRNDPLIRTAFAPHAPYSVSDPALARIRVLADELEVPVHMHVHETDDEIRQSMERFGVRPLERLRGLGLVSPALLAVHMTQLTDTEIESVALAGAHVVHCPESNLKLASGYCPADRLTRAGVNVALGTDGAASNNDLDLLGEMRTAALVAKAVAGNAAAVPAALALRMATLNGARALGLGEQIGSLEPGKAADITAVHLGELETEPVYHPVSQLVYAAARHQITDVWVAGRQLLKNRVLTTLDAAEIRDKARRWRDRIAAPDAQ
ncbi:MAG: N-ethylammeline chlorohydrolase [Chromatiales bacterium 21-64-14]|nr:MAG: N-ethylammeline chlorohydrolase [Chromatiales bacterium 21-64-14]HQU15373.1 TRZ/ATZ family hydrolase [Gammaproteobacteria bacterium]